jgi:hypothetical protein
MKKLTTICVVLTALLPVILLASPTLINFDDASHMEVVNNKYEDLGITFIGMSGSDVIGWSPPPSSNSPVSGTTFVCIDPFINPYEGIRLNFSTPVTSLSLYGCDFGGSVKDLEIATLEAFDESSALLGSTTVQSVRVERLPGNYIDIAFLSLSGIGNIAYAKFTFANTTGFFGIDDVDFTPIPAPGAVLLGGIGVGLVGWLRRRMVL